MLNLRACCWRWSLWIAYRRQAFRRGPNHYDMTQPQITLYFNRVGLLSIIRLRLSHTFKFFRIQSTSLEWLWYRIAFIQLDSSCNSYLWMAVLTIQPDACHTTCKRLHPWGSATTWMGSGATRWLRSVVRVPSLECVAPRHHHIACCVTFMKFSILTLTFQVRMSFVMMTNSDQELT